MTFTPVTTMAALTDGGATQVKAAGRTLVLVRIGDDVFVLDDRCSHEDFSLAEGEVDLDDATIECARHGALFSLRDGAAVTFPATRPVAAYTVRVVDGAVEVDLP